MTSTYKEVWGSKVGKDCIDLCVTLPKWLGKRLLHLAKHSHSYPINHTEESWSRELRTHGEALRDLAKYGDNADEQELKRLSDDAAAALHWVADNLGSLWD